MSYRSHHCGELRISDVGQKVVLSGWVQKGRDLGGMTFIDLRDRYGITQLVFNMDTDESLCKIARSLGREFVITASGEVTERSNKNPDRPTGEIEINVEDLTVVNPSKTPPFTIEEETDGGEELRMKYRYLDIRRDTIQKKLIFRSKLALETRKYLDSKNFIEVETPFLIKSTPEGARDFVVPSRMNKGEFYALPQSPQTFKQLLMVSGMERYFQIVKCFRDEDLRADRQPEFTQIDCEMAFVDREEVLDTFESLTKHLFRSTLNIELGDFPRLDYNQAIEKYGSDKPDLRFDMPIHNLNQTVKDSGFVVFDSAEYVGGICVPGVADEYSNKDLKKLTEWVQRPQIGAKGLVYAKFQTDGSIKSSVGKFFNDDQLLEWLDRAEGSKGDLLLILAGDKDNSLKQLGALRLEMGKRLGYLDSTEFKPLWVLDFPLLEWDEDTQRFYAMHHPFTAPAAEDIYKMDSPDREVLKNLKANAYDLVINGAEIGGGSIRIHDRKLQARNFKLLGFTAEEAEEQFGFLMGAFEYGAPPHGGIAFGFDRLCAVMNHQNSIRDFIAFPKNNMGRDLMINAPAPIDKEQLKDLGLDLKD
nr:aspartate--tRNA ligase [Saprospiraceae bacterium]